MSLSTLIGFVIGLGLFLSSIVLSTNNYLIFFNLPSLFLVAGGTLACSFVSYQSRYVWLSLKNVGRLFIEQQVGRKTLNKDTAMTIRWGAVLKKGGLPALEQEIRAINPPDNFLIFGLELVVSGYSGEEVRETLASNIESTFGRNMVQVDILRAMASTAPAFGMIGTLVGLIIMLESMGSDTSQLGQGMAVALITTLYGVLIARLLLLPAASKAQQKEEIARFRNYLLLEGFVMLAENRSPQYMVDKMNSFLDPSIQYRRKAAAQGKPK
ncbi:MAG: MotA/TolQ/ExbB proton channel family protein [Pseudomonadota bacterium]